MNPPQGPKQNEVQLTFNAKTETAAKRLETILNVNLQEVLRRSMQIAEALGDDDAKGKILHARKNTNFLPEWEKKTILEIFLSESDLGASQAVASSRKLSFNPATFARLNNISTYTNIMDSSELISHAVVFLDRLCELEAQGWMMLMEDPANNTTTQLRLI